MLLGRAYPTGSHRHADPITLDHLISLQKQVAEMEKQIKNILDHSVAALKERQLLQKNHPIMVDALLRIALPNVKRRTFNSDGHEEAVLIARDALKRMGLIE